MTKLPHPASLALAAVLLAAGLPLAAQAQHRQSAKTQAAPRTAAMSMLDPVGSFAPMLERVIPAVVTVQVVGESLLPVEYQPRGADGRMAAVPKPEKQRFRSGGSGVIVDAADGIIITNNHVIENAVQIFVVLSDGTRMPARLIGRDIGADVAVVKVDWKGLPSLPVGDSDKVRIGDVVAAVGNPFGLEGTATLGIVSALMRTEVGHGTFEDFMQIDAPINPGNSGGALVNVRGELIGINTAGGGGPGATGIGFAIPINMARAIKAEIVKTGSMKRGSPGLLVEDLTPDLMSSLGTKAYRGALIDKVVPGSPADKAGIKPGGIVTAVSGKPVRGAAEFGTRVSTVPAGTALDVVIEDKGAARTFKLSAVQIVLEPERHTLSKELGGVAGAVVGDITFGNPKLGTLRGAEVLDVPQGSPAYAAGLERGDVLVGVDDRTVRSSEDLIRSLQRTGMGYRVKIVRDGVTGWLRVSR